MCWKSGVSLASITKLVKSQFQAQVTGLKQGLSKYIFENQYKHWERYPFENRSYQEPDKKVKEENSRAIGAQEEIWS